MTRYTVEANTGSSMWPVAEFRTSPEVEEYLRRAAPLHISAGNPGMFVAPRAADSLVQLLSLKLSKSVEGQDTDVHEQAIYELAGLVQLAATHHGAQVTWQTAENPTD